MPKLKDVCRHIRSKNAGPFWVTVDLFFADRRAYDHHAPSVKNATGDIANRLGVEEGKMKLFALPDLLAMKISYPRLLPQGGALERDMHGGQQYVSLLDLELELASGANHQ